MKHLTDIPQAAQGMGLIELIALVLMGLLVGALVGSIIASWVMAVVCRTVLRFKATFISCFAAYWQCFFVSILCGVGLGLWQAFVFAGTKAKPHELLPFWTFLSLTILTTIASVLIYGLRVKDDKAHHLGLARAIGLVFIHPLVMIGLVAFVVMALDLVWDMRGLDPLGGWEWLKEQLPSKLRP